MNIGLLALQGAVSEHKIIMRQLDINTIEVREREDIDKLDGLIMPGGESTTLRKLLKNSRMWDTIKDSELPIMGTCAGAILLGKCKDETLEKMDIENKIPWISPTKILNHFYTLTANSKIVADIKHGRSVQISKMKCKNENLENLEKIYISKEIPPKEAVVTDSSQNIVAIGRIIWENSTDLFKPTKVFI